MRSKPRGSSEVVDMRDEESTKSKGHLTLNCHDDEGVSLLLRVLLAGTLTADADGGADDRNSNGF